MGGWNKIDLTGQTFGRLIAVERVENSESKFAKWLCRCECGNTSTVFMTSLTSGQTQSCGCLRRERALIKLAKARATRTRNRNPLVRSTTYRSWETMRVRCLNPDCEQYKWYGGRGITIDPRWDSFENFVADMGERPLGTTLDRIDGDGPYTAANCRWADHLTQANNRRGNRPITYNGQTQNMSEWAREYGMRRGTLFARLDAGWDFERALTTPIRGRT